MSIFEKLFGRSRDADIQAIIQQGAFLVDVRTPAEFSEGHVNGSVNIPLNTILSQLTKFNNKTNIIVFCRSGARSSQAKSILEQHGYSNVVNGGTWHNVSKYVQ